VRDVGIVRGTVAASAVLAAIALVTGLVFGQAPIGAGLAAGLVIGALNGELIRRAAVHNAPFVVSSVIRLAIISAVGILAAYVLGASTIALLLGVAAAQFVMVGAAVREGLRA
jgi:hypothetical protein